MQAPTAEELDFVLFAEGSTPTSRTENREGHLSQTAATELTSIVTSEQQRTTEESAGVIEPPPAYMSPEAD